MQCTAKYKPVSPVFPAVCSLATAVSTGTQVDISVPISHSQEPVFQVASQVISHEPVADFTIEDKFLLNYIHTHN